MNLPTPLLLVPRLQMVELRAQCLIKYRDNFTDKMHYAVQNLLYNQLKNVFHSEILILVNHECHVLLKNLSLPSPLDLGCIFSFLIYTVGRAPWMGDQSIARLLSTHRINTHRHLCLEWDSTP
jgi:hypothetical protein